MRILLVDDHRMVREGLRSLLEREGLEVVGEAASGDEGITLAARLRPDIVVMDIAMAGLNGVDATRRLIAAGPRTRVIGLSMSADRRYVVAMFNAGAAGYLLKSSAADELVRALHAVASGLRYVSPGIAGVVLDSLHDGAPRAEKALSPREREVLQLLAEGASSKDIASRLGVAVPTVETHRRQIMEKLGLHTVAELTKYAIREGLTTVE